MPKAPVPQTYNINIQNFSFNPGTLTINKGDTVIWTNNDSAPHQIKSATFNSNTLSNGGTFSFTFTDAGTYNYSCAIHPSMTGSIIVQ
jgi:plastocyanin